MASIRSIFTLDTPYQEDAQKFISFLENNVPEFFSNVGGARYTVPHLLIRSTINEGRVNYQGAKHRKVWKDLANVINHIQPNTMYQNMHQAEIFKMIHDEAGGSYQRLINQIRKFITNFEDSDLQFNVVKYTYVDNYSKSGGYIK